MQTIGVPEIHVVERGEDYNNAHWYKHDVIVSGEVHVGGYVGDRAFEPHRARRKHSPIHREMRQFTTPSFVWILMDVLSLAPSDSGEKLQLILIRARQLEGVAALEGEEIFAVDMRLHGLDLADVDDGRAVHALQQG